MLVLQLVQSRRVACGVCSDLICTRQRARTTFETLPAASATKVATHASRRASLIVGAESSPRFQGRPTLSHHLASPSSRVTAPKAFPGTVVLFASPRLAVTDSYPTQRCRLHSWVRLLILEIHGQRVVCRLRHALAGTRRGASTEHAGTKSAISTPETKRRLASGWRTRHSVFTTTVAKCTRSQSLQGAA